MKDSKIDQVVNISRELLEYIIDFLTDAMFVIDREGRVIRWNKALEEMTGVKAQEILGRGDNEIAVPFYGYKRPVLAHFAMDIDSKDIEKNYSTIKREGDVLIAEVYVPFPGYKKEGSWLWGRAAPLYGSNGEIIGAIEVVRDITERKRMEEERLLIEKKMLELEKQKMIEILAAGVAHDFNNILMAISGYSDIISISIDEKEKIRKSVEEIKKAVIRGSELSQQMLRFAGKSNIVFETVHVSQIVKDIMDLLRVSISRKIEIKINESRENILVRGDITQLKQVILNLVINAAEAIGDKNGLINIEISPLNLNEDYLRKILIGYNLECGNYVRIAVSDNGCGMDEETQKHIFEPFFSTKFAGRGLGMAEVNGIIKAHKGAIKIHSKKGAGTTFEIYIPAILDSDNRFLEKAEKILIADRLSGTILLVDDEESIRLSVGAMLKKLGFEVLMAEDGEQAYKLYLSLKEKPDILLVDIIMPQKDGIELLNDIRNVMSEQKVLLMSGFTGEQFDLSRFDEKITSFIHKPFDADLLYQKICKLIKKEETE